MDTNPYTVLSYRQLIQFVQAEARLNFQKMSPKKRMKRANALLDARAALIEKIKGQDRFSPQFFPIGSRVIFEAWQNGRIQDEGTVTGLTQSHVLVRYDKDGEWAKPKSTLPKDLKLMHVRQKYK